MALFSTLFTAFACLVALLAARGADRTWGRTHGVGLGAALVALIAFAPLGSALALVLGTAAIAASRHEERRRLPG